jgi:non-specific serine/threonine protein kinase
VLGAALDIGELLTACPQLRALVTSREPLRLAGEQELRIPPLGQSQSVELFVERARAVNIDFSPRPDIVSTIHELCRQLEGLPLAIELAAARARLLPPRAMLARFQPRLAMLTGGPRDAPTRQQTLRDTIAWSYNLLDAEEQALFRRLAVFVGGCALEAAEAICASGATVIAERIESLVAKNLLRPVTDGAGDVRVTMLETVREFGIEQLAWSNELERLRRRHAAYFLALAEQAEPALGGPDIRTWVDLLEIERDNLRAALEWSLTRHNQRDETGLRLAGALGRFWWISGQFAEGRRWLKQALAHAEPASTVRMKALCRAGWLAHVQRDSRGANALLEESLAIAEQQHNQWWRAWVLHVLGRVAYFDYDASRAAAMGQRSLQIAELLGDTWLIAWALHLLGLAAYIAGDYTAATEHYERSLALRRELGHLEGLCIVLHLKGVAVYRLGRSIEALALVQDALAIARQINSTWFFNCVLPVLASIAAAHDPGRAARLGGAVSAMCESTQTLPIPITEALFNEGMQTARRKLGDAAFDSAWAAGHALARDSVLTEAEAIDLVDRDERPASLTRTEVEVLRRLARGLTTREIADELVVAASTVDRHITHIYDKIGQRGRSAATTFALQHGLSYLT